MILKLEKYRYLWESDIREYVLSQLSENDRPVIYNPHAHSLLLIHEDRDVVNEIINHMIEAGVERFTNAEDLFKKYPAPADWSNAPIYNKKKK